MDERVQCAVADCLKPTAAIFCGQFYCRGHFIVTCYERLDFCADLLRTRNFSQQTSEEMRKFIAECTQQAAKLSETAKDLNHIERARLLDILFYASDIGRHMRRSPRKSLAIPVRLQCESPAREWQEDTCTRSLSRYGGMFECQHEVKPDDVLVVKHLDAGRSAPARFVWGWRARSGSFVVALEFTDCDNFWEFDWTESPADSVLSQPSSA
ncbi:MAG: hypothetical protein M1453_10825 [Acidobacteria bacterium]|nr:hypothetical protein [Acidobacteriota bacterium]MCL5288472.1 hypothetical protein [Acidobacteriota bacterium]